MAAGCLDFLVIILTAVVVGSIYHYWAYGEGGFYHAYYSDALVRNLQLCTFAAGSFVIANAVRKEYEFSNYLNVSGHAWRSLSLWTIVVFWAVTASFLVKPADDPSRAVVLLVYAIGFLAIYAARVTLSSFYRSMVAEGGISVRRVFLVGFENDLERFTYRHKPWNFGMRIVAAIALRDSKETLKDDLILAAAAARMLRPDDIFILAPWSRSDVIESCVTAFLRVPARVHLGPESVLDRFSNAHIDRVGSISSLSLSGHPLSVLEIAAKRSFDFAAALFGIILLAPLFVVVAALIKLDSRGPVFFLQRRYGFNQETFRIIKFRTMTTLDDGREIRQAQARDLRITGVGRILRRCNIDELPQLFNVLLGDMSLVGPRPHALAHDQLFERNIALYARRHNVKPGITGWAQVNGLRGEVDTPEKIRMRVEHDLYYIDNWSLIFDAWILFLTLFSRKAYRNAV